ncbi:MnhB domain-containing protein [Saccharomonospora xinjiangensis]|uniref:Multisubunit Na+/H+ antiporter, MnhB subunit n=1 Tax=Saccharomonospora xinjiangensis XJ-54 TaxID=882086 RepID=I0UXQ5_9PSEU|nr:MnhB domain-containing protein [Saccharomonospora xinjiangensis]EID52658.1 multisubunit Na+/H+ antiporter, MnhB subunit [Saccharomonospora xinjiangensis XJ-54]
MTTSRSDAAAQRWWDTCDRPREHWLMRESERTRWPRSLLLEVSLRIVFPTVLLVAIYLLFAGHTRAGGGFSGGLVAGLAFVLRYVAGGSVTGLRRSWVQPPVVVGFGLIVALLSAIVPVFFGLPVLSTAVWTVDVPLLGSLKIASSLAFDSGVFLLIVGVVLNLLRTLGEGIHLGELESELHDQQPGGTSP